MSRWLLVVVIALSANTIASSQTVDRSKHQLLWKISGNGLKKPSYLFGTMHVRDKEAFDFSDSVLYKLEACEAFALEVHPDSAVSLMLTEMLIGKNEPETELKNLLSAEEYKMLDSLLIARDSISLDDIYSADRINSFLMEKFQKNDMPSFLDAWLYRIADQQNKTILGLEDMRDQVNLLKDGAKEDLDRLRDYLRVEAKLSHDVYARFLRIYRSGNLDSIHSFSKLSTKKRYDEMVTNRNIVMTNSIVKAIHKQTTFNAVGAAHLPGKEGIINLLRERGYKVTPVKGAFTNLASRYTYKSAERKWVEFVSDEGGYAIEMPKKPVSFTPDETPMTFQAYTDIGMLNMFMTTHFEFPVKGRSIPELLEQFSTGFAEKSELVSKKTLTISGHDAIELETIKNGQFMRAQITIRGSEMYMLLAGVTKEGARSAEADRFFNSFRFVPRKAAGTEELVNKAGAFSINMPGKPRYQFNSPKDPSANRNYKIHLYVVSSDEGDGVIFRYNDFIPGYVSQNDTMYVSQLLQDLMKRMQGRDLVVEKIRHQGFPCTRFKFGSFSDDNTVAGFVILRGNRFYLGMATGEARIAEADDFLQSLRFLPYQHTETKVVDFPEGISLRVPEKFEQDSTIEIMGEDRRYSFVDVNSGIMTLLQVETLDHYTEARDAETYFKSIQENLLNEGDSVVAHGMIAGKQPMYEFKTISSLTNAQKRIRVAVADDKLYSLWCYLPNDHASSNLPTAMFDSFTVKPKGTWNLFTDKTQKLLNDLKSTDSLVFVPAQDAIRLHAFDTTDLSALYQAIEYRYADDTARYSIRHRLLSELRQLKDETTLPFIQKIYPSLHKNVRDNALSVLASLQTEEATKTILQLMQAETRNNYDGYRILSDYYDSLELIAPVLPQLFLLEPRFDSNYYLISLTGRSVAENMFNPEQKERVVKQALVIANRILAEPLPGEEDDAYYGSIREIDNIATLLAKLPFTADVKALLLKAHATKNAEVRLTTGPYLLQQKVAIPSRDFDVVAEDPYYRFQLYDTLKALDKLKLMNKKYRTPEMLAESNLYEVLSDYEEYFDTLAFVSSKTVTFEGKSQKIFLFKYQSGDGPEWFTAMAGPYNLKSKTGIKRSDYTTPFYEPFVTTAELEEHALAHLKDIEAQDEED